MVDSQIALLVDGGQLKLVGSHLVVTCLHRDSQLQRLNLQILHKGLYTVRYGAEVVVIHLLVLGTLVAHQRATRHQQVRACRVQTLVHQEILLFPSQVHLNLGDVVVEILANILGGLSYGMQGTQQRSLIVERLTCVGDEYGRDTQRVVDDEHRACGVPG